MLIEGVSSSLPPERGGPVSNDVYVTGIFGRDHEETLSVFGDIVVGEWNSTHVIFLHINLKKNLRVLPVKFDVLGHSIFLHTPGNPYGSWVC